MRVRVVLPILAVMTLLIIQSVLGTLADHKNIVYVVPRPGIDKRTDCYINLYHQEIERDVEIIYELGATTVVTTNQWQWDSDHSEFLALLQRFNLSLAVTLIPDLGDNSMRRYLKTIKEELDRFEVRWEFLYVDFDLNFDNAEAFFMFAGKLRTWLDQLGLETPLIVRFFKDVTSTVQIDALLEAWDWTEFDAWGVHAFSDKQIATWMNFVGEYTKRIFIFYGADSVNVSAPPIRGDQTLEKLQAQQLEHLWRFVTHEADNATRNETLLDSVSIPTPKKRRLGGTFRTMFQDVQSDAADPPHDASPPLEDGEPDEEEPAPAPVPSKPPSNSTILLGTALLGYVDTFFLGEEPQHYQGAAGDICPDMNPYLQTTCGVRDPFVIHGDAIVSAEYLGLFGTSETLLLSRCVISKASVAAVRGLWSSSKEAFPVDKYCCFSISVYPVELIWVTLGFVGMAIIISVVLSIAASICACRERKQLRKHQELIAQKEKMALLGAKLSESDSESISSHPIGTDIVVEMSLDSSPVPPGSTPDITSTRSRGSRQRDSNDGIRGLQMDQVEMDIIKAKSAKKTKAAKSVDKPSILVRKRKQKVTPPPGASPDDSGSSGVKIRDDSTPSTVSSSSEDHSDASAPALVEHLTPSPRIAKKGSNDSIANSSKATKTKKKKSERKK